ncbi:hypothetical protein CGI74_23540 [Vibrio parahaemolyticus]|uniref:restriction endonuclease n=1 Tax=Vibrio parahaemolyticus TaxID=670 RepID=UPI00111E390F|nr:restriction endonuclease [Vibrio parahaemolyticus]TOH74822.1 hypothetical protein CGI74_23540 [Vibrio parahaemolyticus]TOM85746.1 hypothetical protein CGH68_21095 [Vibrio parahaemolyticus]
MAVLDFREIPEAHIASGQQDMFELFARDFLAFIGYKIITEPDRGADGGVDLIVEESRTGVGGETVIRWLVSCKHKAHSGRSVSPTDDGNIRDRVEASDCNGFIGFYSTLASAGLAGNLEGMQGRIETQIFDYEKIESKLLHSAKGLQIAERYFPVSLSEWRTENPQPAQIFSIAPSLKCHVCDNELFEQEDKGVVTLWSRNRVDFASEPEFIEQVSWTCRGRCDDLLQARMRQQHPNLIDGWEDISDVMIPTIFIKWVMSILNQQREGTLYSDEAFSSLKSFMLRVFPYVARHLTSQEKEQIEVLMMIPSYLGGLGNDG